MKHHAVQTGRPPPLNSGLSGKTGLSGNLQLPTLRNLWWIIFSRKGAFRNLLQLRALAAAHAEDHDALQFHRGLFLFQLRAQPGIKFSLFGEFPGRRAALIQGKREDFHAHQTFAGQEGCGGVGAGRRDACGGWRGVGLEERIGCRSAGLTVGSKRIAETQGRQKEQQWKRFWVHDDCLVGMNASSQGRRTQTHRDTSSRVCVKRTSEFCENCVKTPTPQD